MEFMTKYFILPIKTAFHTTSKLLLEVPVVVPECVLQLVHVRHLPELPCVLRQRRGGLELRHVAERELWIRELKRGNRVLVPTAVAKTSNKTAAARKLKRKVR